MRPGRGGRAKNRSYFPIKLLALFPTQLRVWGFPKENLRRWAGVWIGQRRRGETLKARSTGSTARCLQAVACVGRAEGNPSPVMD